LVRLAPALAKSGKAPKKGADGGAPKTPLELVEGEARKIFDKMCGETSVEVIAGMGYVLLTGVGVCVCGGGSWECGGQTRNLNGTLCLFY
jgi:hypothetical protein